MKEKLTTGTSLDIVSVTKSWNVRWVGHVARMVR
jgi:hypothetical protein